MRSRGRAGRGLADTVIDANEAALGAGVATRLLFTANAPMALHGAIAKVIRLHGTTGTWPTLQKAGMQADFSWAQSAAHYVALFEQLVRQVA